MQSRTALCQITGDRQIHQQDLLSTINLLYAFNHITWSAGEVSPVVFVFSLLVTNLVHVVCLKIAFYREGPKVLFAQFRTDLTHRLGGDKTKENDRQSGRGLYKEMQLKLGKVCECATSYVGVTGQNTLTFIIAPPAGGHISFLVSAMCAHFCTTAVY